MNFESKLKYFFFIEIILEIFQRFSDIPHNTKLICHLNFKINANVHLTVQFQLNVYKIKGHV